MTTLYARGQVKLYVVSQIIKAEFVVRTVSYVGSVGGLPFEVVHVVLNAADFESQETMYLAHPLGIARRQIVIYSDYMDASPAREGVQIRGQRVNERLALTCAHLGDLALVQDDAANHLHVEMAH